MDLQTFVSETLLQVNEGIKAAIVRGVRVAELSTYREVDFDVAVTVSETAGRKGGAGIFVGGMGLGGHASSQGTSSSVSRIRFAVPVLFPGGDG